MPAAFTITRPNGEAWQFVPQPLHESKFAQWWQLYRDGAPSVYSLIPKKYGRREIIREFETLLNPTTEEVTL